MVLLKQEKLCDKPKSSENQTRVPKYARLDKPVLTGAPSGPKIANEDYSFEKSMDRRSTKCARFEKLSLP